MCDEESKIQWKHFLSGDNKAYGWLYDKYIQSLYRYGLFFTPDGETVKDCIQDVFTRLYKNRKNLVVPENVKVYLFVSLKNSLFKSLHNDYVYNRDEKIPLTFQPEPTAEDQYIDNEQQAHQKMIVNKIMSQLSQRQREIIYYRFIRELSWDEICKLMSLNYQSAQNLTQRALKKIRTHFNSTL